MGTIGIEWVNSYHEQVDFFVGQGAPFRAAELRSALSTSKDPQSTPTRSTRPSQALSSSHLPIGSGVAESAAKTVVGRRAKNSGQHWSEPGCAALLTLRALHQSDRVPRFWRLLSRRYLADVADAS